MNQPDSTLTPAQRGLQELAVRQLAGVSVTLQRLQGVTADQSDREAVQDAQGSAYVALKLLTEWFGTEPADE